MKIKILKAILGIYIILAIIVAGLNYGYANNTDSSLAEFITWFWHFYENWIKTLLIIIGSYLTLNILRTSQRFTMRKKNLIGFVIAALIVHITAPILLQNSEVYLFAMPPPWTTTPLQLLHPQSSIYLSRYPLWGLEGISGVLVFYLCYSIMVIAGTLMYGRRWQCSTICLFNGFASEIFEPAIPLIGKKKKIGKRALRIFTLLRWFSLFVALFFTIWWILFLFDISLPGNFQFISRMETIKYLTTDLLMMMFFWVAFIGRGYCYYCPLGTVLAFISKLAGQKIITNKAKCIHCNQCNKACPMSIDIKSKAQNQEPVTDLRCVGCGHCIDICPTKTLVYSTNFLEWIRKRKN
jgi:ferredoxin-type protein NapH